MLINLDEAIKLVEELPIGGGTLSSWINANESPMGATRRHIAEALRALPVSDGWEDMEKVARSLYFKLAVDELGIVNGSKLYDTGEYPEGTPDTVHCLLEDARKVFGLLPAPPTIE